MVLVLVPGSVFAWRALDGGGPQPHDVLPADAIGYFRVDLDPSAGQKIEAFRFLRNFPAVDDALGTLDDDDDIREVLLDKFAEGSGCDIDFEADVDPWMGERLGGAVLPSNGADGGTPPVVIALQIDDEEAAESALREGLGCADTDADADAFGRAYLDGYMLISDTQENADRYAEAAQESALSSNTEFTEAMDLLGDPGVASLWISGTGIIDAFEGSLDEFGPPGSVPGGAAPSLSDVRGMIEDAYSSAALSMRFDDSHGEIAAVTVGETYEQINGVGVDPDLPEDTALMVGVAHGGDYLAENWGFIGESNPMTKDMFDGLGETMGLTFPDDLNTVLGENLLIAVDGRNLDLASLIESDDASSLGAGVKVTTDPEAVRGIWDKLQDWAQSNGVPLGGVPLEFTDDGYVIASNPDYGAALSDGGSLGDSSAYQSAVEDADSADMVFFLNFDVVEESVVSMLEESAQDEDVIESVRNIEALGYSAHVHDGHIKVTMRLTAN